MSVMTLTPSVDDVSDSAGDVADATGLESAYENLESAIDDIPDDMSISDAFDVHRKRSSGRLRRLG